MQYRLRTLLIVLAIGPPVLIAIAIAIWGIDEVADWPILILYKLKDGW